MRIFALICSISLGAGLAFPQEILSLGGIQPGQKGIGRTVFQGTAPQDFDVEILGVLENIGPRQSIILARLSGGPLEKTGVMQGMSGSPVYIGGKLIGAVALAFPYSKDAIAGIRPIEEMLASGPSGAASPRASLTAPGFGESRLTEVATPVSFAGFTSRAIEHFAPQWRKFGLEPLQGIGGRASATTSGAGRALEPGSMISVQLVSGDLSIGADGTVTMIQGEKIYAFGHRLMGLGSAEIPFARSEVIALLPNLASSFKISTSHEPLGAITQDGNAAIAGSLRKTAATLPVRIDVTGAARQASYRMDMIDSSILTPFLLQMAIFSAIDGTERTLGSSTISVSGQVRFAGGLPPLRIDQSVAGDFNAPVMASLGSAMPLASLLQTSSDPVKVAGIDLTIRAAETRRLWQIEHVSVSRRKVRPGDTVRISVVLNGADALDEVRHIDYVVPTGVPAGNLLVAAADAISANLAENRFTGMQGRPAIQILNQVNAMRKNSSAWVRISRPEPAIQVAGTDFGNLPAGMSLLLGREQGPQILNALSGSRIFEAELAIPDGVVTGVKTASIEVVR